MSKEVTMEQMMDKLNEISEKVDVLIEEYDHLNREIYGTDDIEYRVLR